MEPDRRPYNLVRVSLPDVPTIATRDETGPLNASRGYLPYSSKLDSGTSSEEDLDIPKKTPTRLRLLVMTSGWMAAVA